MGVNFRWVTRVLAGAGLAAALVAAPAVSARSLARSDAATAQSVPGNWVSAITVLNPSTNSASANVVVDFYDSNGNLVSGAEQTASVAPGATAFWYVPGITALPSGQAYSAVVSSDQQVYATVNLNTASNTSPVMGETYNGVDTSAAAATVAVPSVLRNYHGFSSNIVVENTGASAAGVTIRFAGSGSSGAVDYTTPTQTIAPDASYTFDLASMSSLGDNFSGGATVNGNGANVAVIANNYTPSTSSSVPNYLFSSSNGFAEGSGVSGSTVAYIPGLYKDYHGFTSALIVQNADSSPANVTVSYANGATDTINGLAPGASQVFYTPGNPNLPEGWEGAATVTSTNGMKILTQVNVQGNGGDAGVGLASYSGFQSGYTDVFVPGLVKNYHGYVSALTVQNVDKTPATVTVTYSNGVTHTNTVNPGQSWLLYLPSDSALPDGFNGGATITSNGPKIVGLVNIQGDKTADQLFSTNAFGSN